jgi:hypothetical protein
MIEATQQAAQRVEDRVLEFLIQYEPMQDASIRDLKQIAFFARQAAFAAFADLSDEN